jgi:RNA polymerase I-specific transcription initiation factor RRN3
LTKKKKFFLIKFLSSRNYQIVFCYSIIETNNRYSLPELFTINDYSPIIPSNILYSYFPFDPYVLKRSSIFIRPIYNDYRDENDDLPTKDSDDNDVRDIDDSDDVLTSMMMSTTPNSFDPMSTSLKNSRNILPFGRSPGFRNIS